MDPSATPSARAHGRARRSLSPLATALGAAVLSTVLAVPLLPAQAVGPRAVQDPTGQQQAREREQQALADLAESSAEVRAAAAALSTVAAQLPGAQADVARARGELAGARAKVAAANAALAEAERAQAEAAREVAAADAKVEQSREDVGLLARRTYQRGRLGDLRDVMEASEPQDVLERAGLLRSVFRHRDASLDQLTDDRLALAATRAELAAEEREVARKRAEAQEGEARARQITAEAEQARARVASLVAARASALRTAEGARAADQREYQEAQAASRALAERIREAARRAAAEAARKKAAEEAQRKAAERAALQAAAAQRAAEAKAAEAAEAAEAARQAGAVQSTRRRPAPAPAAPQVAAAPRSSGRTGGMRWPCGGCPQTSSFGWRTHPLFGDRRFHAGIDMGAPIGATVVAADGGTVIFAGRASGYGTLVVVSHGVVGGRDLSTAYAHMSSLSVSTGQSVARGEKVGEVGNEGNSTGPHLHFEVRRDGEPVDPRSFVSP